MRNLETLSALGPGGLVHVIVEASRGMTAKCKYEPSPRIFVFGRPLPHGLLYPFDWGFIPSTQGGDGDPLDALVLHDAACPVGCLIRCQPLGMLSIAQRVEGKRQRNDRFLLRPAADKAMKQQHVLTARLKLELENFFKGVVLGSGKTLIFQGWHGPDKALAAIHKGARRFQAGQD
jgi:inorganic pyrophosphatase